jgi:hypothetical protein
MSPVDTKLSVVTCAGIRNLYSLFEFDLHRIPPFEKVNEPHGLWYASSMYSLNTRSLIVGGGALGLTSPGLLAVTLGFVT